MNPQVSPSTAIFESLQKEFCPPLDSSLVAALLADIDFDVATPSATSSMKPLQLNQHLQASIDALRDTLKQLAVQAEFESQLSDNLTTNENLGSEQSDEGTTPATSLEPDFLSSDDGGKFSMTDTTRSSNSRTSKSITSSSSSVSGSSQQSFDSPLGFLQAALPHVPTKRLAQALLDAGKEVESNRLRHSLHEDSKAGEEEEELDMWDVIASILTAESIREMEERGIAGLDEDDEKLARALAGDTSYEIEEDEMNWETVVTRRRKKPHKHGGWDQHYERDFLHHTHGFSKAAGKKKHKQGSSSQRQHTAVKFTLGDVRQQQHVVRKPYTASFNLATANASSAPSPDPWTQVSSLSSHVATLVSSHAASFFQSYFHSPKYSSPYEALCAALQVVCDSDSSKADLPKNQHPTTSRTRKPNLDEAEKQNEFEHATLLFNLLDILLPQYEFNPLSHNIFRDLDDVDGDGEMLLEHQQNSNPGELEVLRTRLVSDIQLAVKATQGRGDDALDLVTLLRELDEDKEGGWKIGVYHHGSVASELRTNGNYVRSVASRSDIVRSAGDGGTSTSSTPKPPSALPPIPQPPLKNVRVQPTAPVKNKPSPYQWQAVHTRKTVSRPVYALAHHFPTYTKDVIGHTHRHATSLGLATGITSNAWVRGMDGALGTKGLANADIGALLSGHNVVTKGESNDMSEYRSKIGETMRKRNDLLREAARMWKKGNNKTRGGDVALYFAERARQLQDIARHESLNAARAMVLSKRVASGDQDTVDLHGTTVTEALVIVKEVLKSQTTSQAKPLKIITGRGSHSANRVGVLKPAIKKALMGEGWIVGTWDGGLVVRGRKA